MPGRIFRWFGMTGAAVCGVATAYTALQPALEEQSQQKQGTFADQHKNQKDQETAISQAIISDFKEAKEELTKGGGNGGFAWGIRQLLFGGPSPRQPHHRTTQPGQADEQPRTG